MNTDSKKIFSLFQLLESVERMVAQNYTKHYWIRAEMIKLNRYQEQHCYPEFVEKKNDVIIADIRGIIWSSTFNAINKRFQSVVGESLSDGMKVVLLAKLDFSPKRGFSINVLDIDPTFTLGDMMVNKKQVIEKLKKAELFQKNKLLPSPILPRRIAIISVESSKGYQDFNSILNNFSDRYQPLCILFTATLQGEKAVDSLINAFQKIKEKHYLFDLAIIIRGGGSEIGLTCYDDYRLSAEIANFPIPVLTGIGHSTNETVAEMIAWKNLITPTELAYHIIDYYKKFEKELFLLAEKTVSCSNYYIDRDEKKIEQCATKLKWQTTKLIKIHQEKIIKEQHHLKFCIELMISSNKNKLNFTQFQFQNLPYLILQKYSNQLEMIALKIKMSNPHQMTSKGFSITRKEGKVIRSVQEIKKGDVLITEINDGLIQSIVQ